MWILLGVITTSLGAVGLACLPCLLSRGTSYMQTNNGMGDVRDDEGRAKLQRQARNINV